MNRRLLALASACIFLASCKHAAHPPVGADALDGVLLSPTELDVAMNADGMAVNETSTDTSDDSASVPDKDCRSIDDPAETSVYDGSGWSAVRSQHLRAHGDAFDQIVWQAVVSFPSANDAARFFSASAQRWPACSNRQYHSINDPGQPDMVWTVGRVANISDTLSATRSTDGWACQRALTVSNNVIIDVAACSGNPAQAAANIAHQIAAKVAKL